MVVADETHSLQITGTGDVLEPHDGIIGAFTALQLRTTHRAFAQLTRASRRLRPAQPSARAARTRLRQRAR